MFDEIIDLWNDYYNTDKVYDIIQISKNVIDIKCENKKIANEFADYINIHFNKPLCHDFRRGNRCYQFSIYTDLLNEKESARKSIKEAKNITLSDLCDELGISYMDIYAIEYEDREGAYYYCDEMLKVGIKILNNEAIQITGFGTFIGKFNFNDYIKNPISPSCYVLQDKPRYLKIYFK